MKSLALFVVSLAVLRAVPPMELGTRCEMFVDDFLIAETHGVARKLHPPVRREIVLTTDQPWEGPTCAYFTVIQDGTKVRLYYRGSAGGSDHSDAQVTCMAESEDGIHFVRPKLGLIEAGGTRDNNVVWRGVESHNFAPFLDPNPAAQRDERYKALGGIKQPGRNWKQGTTPGGLYAFVSADGIHWRKLRPEPVITKGAFDSQNVALWDPERRRYMSFSRIFADNVRAIQSSTSSDFVEWTDGIPHHYATGVPAEHFYTSATMLAPTVPHLFLSFPMRFVPSRTKVPGHPGGRGVSDAVFMTSRDGVNWDRPFLEAWVRPGPDPKNWTERSNMTACGLYDNGRGEWSLYISEHYRHDDHRIRRLAVRQHGFASVHAGAKPGEFTTHPLTFAGRRLLLNYATSAAGTVQVEIQDTDGQPIRGFSLAESAALFGDELAAVASWKGGHELTTLAGKPVRLRVRMQDADLFALRFGE